MKIGEFKKKIAEIPADMDDCELIMSSDPEGNNYSPAVDINVNSYWVGAEEVYDGSWSAREACMTEKDWEELKKNTPKCVVVWPKY